MRHERKKREREKNHETVFLCLNGMHLRLNSLACARPASDESLSLRIGLVELSS